MMNDILHQIVTHKRLEVERSKQLRPVEELVGLCRPIPRKVRSARAALENSPTGIIAEFKRRSPSRGWIHREADAASVVESYERAGAALCSILTDEHYFGGTLLDLEKARQRVDLPLLRKDFIIDSYQLVEARAAGADLILLIAACLTPVECAALAREAHELDLEVLLEVHTAEELGHITPDIDLLGVNNRHLGTFRTEVETSFRMVGEMARVTRSMERPPLLVSESGLSDPAVVSRLRAAGFQGFLMGEAFMKTTDPAGELTRFVDQVTKSATAPRPFWVKVCGLRDPDNVAAVEQLPIDLTGFIFYPGSSRYVNSRLPGIGSRNVRRVGVFVNEKTEHVVLQSWKHCLDYVQLHGDESPAECEQLRQQGVRVIKALPIASAEDLQRAVEYHGRVDLLLFDTRCSSHGGSGETFDWSLLDSYSGPTPFLLSGGIGPDSVEALNRFRHPFLRGIDLNSRFESAPGVKEVERLRQFLSNLELLT